MSRINAYHIDRGPQLMYPVDVAHAVGNHPYEWSRVPWTDEARREAMPKLKEQRAEAAKLQSSDVGDAVLIAGGNHIGAQVARPAAVTAYPPPASDPQRTKDGKADDGAGDQTPVAQKVTADNAKAVDQAKGGKPDKS